MLRNQGFRRIGRRVTLAIAAGAFAVSAAASPASAVTTPAHSGTFRCGLDASGHAAVTVILPSVKSFYSRERVNWYATVFKQTSTGYKAIAWSQNQVAYTVVNQLGPLTAWLGSINGYTFYSGGSVPITEPGTYFVGDYFQWTQLSSSYYGSWATNQATGGISCTFR